jgi:hypothetical protein
VRAVFRESSDDLAFDIAYARYQFILDCISQHGFSSPNLPPPERPLGSPRYYARTVIEKIRGPNPPKVVERTQAEKSRAYEAAASACATASAEALPDPRSALATWYETVSSDLDARALSDPRALSANATAVECLKPLGYTLASAEESLQSLLDQTNKILLDFARGGVPRDQAIAALSDLDRQEAERDSVFDCLDRQQQALLAIRLAYEAELVRHNYDKVVRLVESGRQAMENLTRWRESHSGSAQVSAATRS